MSVSVMLFRLLLMVPFGGLLRPPLVTGHQLRQIVGDGQVELVDWAPPEEGAGGLEAGKVVERVQPEELPVRLGVGQVVSRDVGHGAEALEDAVLLGVVHDALGDRLLVAEHAHVVVERGQVAVDHLGVVADPNLHTDNNSCISTNLLEHT